MLGFALMRWASRLSRTFYSLPHTTAPYLTASTMQITVRFPSKEEKVDVEPDAKVEDFRAQVEEANGGRQCYPLRLIVQGKEMADGKTLSDYGVTSDAVVHAFLRLNGG